jgi:hypothetical protein
MVWRAQTDELGRDLGPGSLIWASSLLLTLIVLATGCRLSGLLVLICMGDRDGVELALQYIMNLLYP